MTHRPRYSRLGLFRDTTWTLGAGNRVSVDGLWREADGLRAFQEGFDLYLAPARLWVFLEGRRNARKSREDRELVWFILSLVSEMIGIGSWHHYYFEVLVSVTGSSRFQGHSKMSLVLYV